MRLLFGLSLLLLFLAMNSLLVTPPAPQEAAADGEFQTERAFDRVVRVYGSTSHPADSDANDEVRSRLVGELEAAGLTPEINDYEHCYRPEKTRQITCMRLRNVVVTLGPATGSHLLINAHYDSADLGLGAGDDGIGIATMMEVATVLADEPLDRPVTFLFNEGEEKGLVGANAFNKRNPIAERVDTLINIEARGSDGPALMYRPSVGDGAILRSYAKASRRPAANSLSSDFANIIPNVSDGLMFDRSRDWHKLEYAIAFNESRYHSSGDVPAALSKASLGHMGVEVLAITRELSSGLPTPAHRIVYTDIAGKVFYAIPLFVAALAMALALVGLVVATFRAKGVGKPFAWIITAYLVGVAGCVAMATLVPMLRTGQFWRGYPDIIYLGVYAAGLAGLVWVVERKLATFGRERARLATWLFVTIVAGTASLFLPGALIFFVASAFIATIACFVPNRFRSYLYWPATLFMILLIGQLLALIEEIMIADALWAGGPFLLLAALPLIVELVFLREATSSPRWLAAPVLTVAALLFAVTALTVPAASSRSPAFWASIIHAQDEDTDPLYVVPGEAPFPDELRRMGDWKPLEAAWLGRGTHRTIPAAARPEPPPRIDIVSRENREGRTTIRFRFGGGDAREYRLLFEAGTAPVSLGLAGQPLDVRADREEPLRIRCVGRQCDDMTFEAQFEGPVPDEVDLVRTITGLPSDGRKLAEVMPDDAVVKWVPHSSMTRELVSF